jgi:hypothetical protein
MAVVVGHAPDEDPGRLRAGIEPRQNLERLTPRTERLVIAAVDQGPGAGAVAPHPKCPQGLALDALLAIAPVRGVRPSFQVNLKTRSDPTG